jgi:hypothetical protein
VDGGLSEEQALEHYSLHVTGSYVGERTPIFIDGQEDKDMELIRARRAGIELSGWGGVSNGVVWE